METAFQGAHRHTTMPRRVAICFHIPHRTNKRVASHTEESLRLSALCDLQYAELRVFCNNFGKGCHFKCWARFSGKMQQLRGLTRAQHSRATSANRDKCSLEVSKQSSQDETNDCFNYRLICRKCLKYSTHCSVCKMYENIVTP